MNALLRLGKGLKRAVKQGLSQNKAWKIPSRTMLQTSKPAIPESLPIQKRSQNGNPIVLRAPPARDTNSYNVSRNLCDHPSLITSRLATLLSSLQVSQSVSPHTASEASNAFTCQRMGHHQSLKAVQATISPRRRNIYADISGR